MTQMLSRKALKAYVAGASAAVAFAVPVVDDGLLPSEVLGIIGAFVAAFQVTYWTRNRKAGADDG